MKCALRGLGCFVLLAVSITLATRLTAENEYDFSIKKFTHDGKPKVSLENIAVKNPESVGMVVGSYKKVNYLTNGDTVYLKMENPSLSKGDRYTVFVDQGGIRPVGSHFSTIGHKILVKAYVEITRVLPKTIEAKIYDATSEVVIGDKLMPLMNPEVVIDPQMPKENIEGRILEGAHDVSLIGSHEFAFIDRGLQDGLRINDRLFVYRTVDGGSEIKKDLPQINIAELVVVHADQKLATVYCLGASDKFESGAAFKTAQTDVTYLDTSTPK